MNQRSMPLHKGIDECSIDELYCALDDLGLDMDRILQLNLTLPQVREIYRGLLQWQLSRVIMKEQLVTVLR
ncbi:MAG: hypothetical protein ABI347_10890 [Nitrososphaera sp.]